MHRFANPARFQRFAIVALPAATFASLCLLALGLWFALFASPPDYQHGEMVRVMYVHVPAAWLSLFIYTVMAFASASYLVWRHPLADIAARASAPLGAMFTLVTLVTGALWGKPAWGTWWVWDARLTSVLILFFLYLGYLMLSSGTEGERGAKLCAILALAGFINIPIIKFSVEWWHTLHQPASLLRMGGSAIDKTMLWPLLIMAGGYFSLYLALLFLRMQALLGLHRIRRLQSRLLSARQPQ